jgi:hypothetical protein
MPVTDLKSPEYRIAVSAQQPRIHQYAPPGAGAVQF